MQPGEKQLGARSLADPGPLLRLAVSEAARLLRNPVAAEEAGERAVHKLFLLTLAGREPEAPAAWVRVAVRRIAQSMLRQRSRRVAVDLDQLAQPSLEAEAVRHDVDHLLHQLLPLLTPRQRQAVDAARTNRSMRNAARQCGMSPKDLRRSLGSVGEKGRQTLQSVR